MCDIVRTPYAELKKATNKENVPRDHHRKSERAPYVPGLLLIEREKDVSVHTQHSASTQCATERDKNKEGRKEQRVRGYVFKHYNFYSGGITSTSLNNISLIGNASYIRVKTFNSILCQLT